MVLPKLGLPGLGIAQLIEAKQAAASVQSGAFGKHQFVEPSGVRVQALTGVLSPGRIRQRGSPHA